ncbi:MAG: 50S ribosomal protein L35 [Erysipelotrichales bacterium]|nr:50S ribosomal protein L35 [Erysipelotrichales bacterium]
MPKMKTHSGLKKRIKVTASGKLLRGHAYTSHLKQNKSTKQNRQLRKKTTVSQSDYKRIKSLISNLL